MRNMTTAAREVQRACLQRIERGVGKALGDLRRVRGGNSSDRRNGRFEQPIVGRLGLRPRGSISGVPIDDLAGQYVSGIITLNPDHELFENLLARRWSTRPNGGVPRGRTELMNKITLSGVYYDELGHLVMVTQGLGGYTLVAGKKILFRLFLDLSAVSMPTVAAIVTYKILGFSIKKTFLVPTASLLIEKSSPNGPSLGIIFTGDVFPVATSALRYSIEFHVHGIPNSAPHFKITELVFLSSGRLRLLIHNLRGTAPWGTQIEPTFAWLIEMFYSLERLSAMMPVRDGIKFGLSHTDVGLCFTYGDNIDAWPAVCPSGVAPPCTTKEMVAVLLEETNAINVAGTAERVDVTVSWRPRDYQRPGPNGEGVGGKAVSYDSPPGKGLAAVVGGNIAGREFTAAILAQEVGHLFGLEPRDSPHFEDPLDGLHSKDPGHFDPFAFDFKLMKPYTIPPGRFLGDVMNNLGGGVGQGSDLVLYNAFDWEHLRKRFIALPGGPRTARLASMRPPVLIATLNAVYAAEPEFNVGRPAESLPARPGHAWQWTSTGLMPARTAGASKLKPSLGGGAEDIRAWLAALGVKKAYSPVGDRPLSLIVNPDATVTLHNEAFDASLNWLEKRRGQKSERSSQIRQVDAGGQVTQRAGAAIDSSGRVRRPPSKRPARNVRKRRPVADT